MAANQITDSAALDKIRTASTAPVGVAARRTPRRTFQSPVGILVRGHYEVLRARQLSEGGISLAVGDERLTLDELKVGVSVCLTVILPSGANLALRGKVIYHYCEATYGNCIGIKFGTVPLFQRRLIRQYVSSKQAGELSDEDGA